jgi:4-hydroxy-tetrahydrodipicolinate synthase
MTLTALITPFLENYEIDWDSFKKLLLFQFSSKIDGIVLIGTTAENSTLTKKEKNQILELTLKIKKQQKSNKQIWLGVSNSSTKEVIELILENNSKEIDGYLISSPCYNKPPQEGLIKHFLECDKNSSKKIMLYNVPSRT